MIKLPTVFVLGAGASQPYNFPVGMELVDQICNQITQTGSEAIPFRNRLNMLGHDDGFINEFVNALRGARPYSIDAFIETRPQFRDISKAAIADVLLRAEANSSVLTAPPKIDWYRYLFNKFLFLKNLSYFSSQAKKLTIVTFNFDRSFEFALFENLRHGFGLADREARLRATELEIHHMHGLLGEPKWLSPDDPQATNYGVPSGELLVTATRHAVGRIKIVDEEIPRSVIEDVQAALKRARFVYFLGFGFDERNLDKLGTPHSIAEATMRGTAFNWSSQELAPVVRHFGQVQSVNASLSFPNVDAIGFLREYAGALFH